MTRIEALKVLLAKVEVGKIYLPDSEKWAAFAFDPSLATRAFYGSLDAAKALHEAVLPGCSQYSMITDPTCICVKMCWWPDGLSAARAIMVEGWHEDIPALAWFIAILHALIAQEEAA